jgi:hypothetical protein
MKRTLFTQSWTNLGENALFPPLRSLSRSRCSSLSVRCPRAAEVHPAVQPGIPACIAQVAPSYTASTSPILPNFEAMATACLVVAPTRRNKPVLVGIGPEMSSVDSRACPECYSSGEPRS